MILKNRIRKILSRWNLQGESVADIYNENTGRQSENAYYIGDDVIKFSANYGRIKNTICIAYRIGENIAKLHNALKAFDESHYKKADILADAQLHFSHAKSEQVKVQPFSFAL